jgi:hypothetical protein
MALVVTSLERAAAKPEENTTKGVQEEHDSNWAPFIVRFQKLAA